MPRMIPAYRQRKGYDQALVTLRDAVTKRARDYWLGPYNTPQSRELYCRVIADWEANGRRLIDPPQLDPAVPRSITILEVGNEYRKWTVAHQGEQDVANVKLTIRVLTQMWGTTEAIAFGPNKLRKVREQMIHGDATAKPPRRPWSRPYINVQVQRIISMFKWAASHELMPATVYQQLRTIEPLRKGKSAAYETDPVKPVPEHLVAAIKEFVSRQVWALIELQQLTGARPCELTRLRPMDIHKDDPAVWTYSPDEHKTSYRGKKRMIYFGPRAQAVLNRFLPGRDPQMHLFRACEADAERRAKRHAERTTPLSCGNAPGTNRTEDPRKRPGDHYTTSSYSRAILVACDKVFPLPEHLAQRQTKGKNSERRREFVPEWKKRIGPDGWKQVVAWRKAHRWHPYQLRHSAATQIRRQFGLEAAQIALGHSSALVTEAVYAERDMEKVMEVMRKVG